MELINAEELKKHMIHDDCDEGCGFIDERDINDIPKVSVDGLIRRIKKMAWKSEDIYVDDLIAAIEDYFGMED